MVQRIEKIMAGNSNLDNNRSHSKSSIRKSSPSRNNSVTGLRKSSNYESEQKKYNFLADVKKIQRNKALEAQVSAVNTKSNADEKHGNQYLR